MLAAMPKEAVTPTDTDAVDETPAANPAVWEIEADIVVELDSAT